MLKFVGRRVLMMLPVILGISFLIFSIMNLTPGDPARVILGNYATDEDVEAWREEKGLNAPFFTRYLRWVAGALRGDLGESYATGSSVTEQLAGRAPTSLQLTTGATILMVLIGVPVGVISAVRQYSIVDRATMVSTLVLTSTPAFWLGLILILVFSLNLNLLPATGTDTWKSFILPSITLSSAVMASLLRMTRSNMLEVIRQDYIRTARAKGAGERTVIWRHALRNALLPIITIVGLSFGTMTGGALVTETVFALPGVGSLLVTSVRMKDTPQVMACVMFISLVIGLANLVVDILYVYVDPRLRTQFVRG